MKRRPRRSRRSRVLLIMLLLALSLPTALFFVASQRNTKASASRTTKPPKFPIGYRTFSLSEPTLAGPRTLGLILIYPSTSASPSPAQNAPALNERGPYPLVVFSQGFGANVNSYDVLVNSWVEAGYVVAEPIYPFTDPSSPVLDRSDIINHPADLDFVINYVLQLSRQSTFFKGMINSNEIAAAGQSDGGDVTLAATEDSDYRIPAIKAALFLSAAEYYLFNGTFFSPLYKLPAYISQGSEDTINPPECSVQIYNSLAQPKYYINLIGADHLEAYTEPNQYEQIVAASSIAFLNTYLKGKKQQAKILADANVPGISTAFRGPDLPPLPTTCPVAPT